MNGGLLIQDRDDHVLLADELTVVSDRAPSEQEMCDLLFAWRVAKFVKSNAIIYAANERTIGVGAGQMSRVNSARIAAIQAEDNMMDGKASIPTTMLSPLETRLRPTHTTAPKSSFQWV